MHAEFSFAHFERSFCASYYFHNQNVRFVEQGAWGKSGTFVQLGIGATMQALHCVHAVFVPVHVVQCHALKRHRPIDKKCNFFILAPGLINSVISQYTVVSMDNE